MRSIVLLIALTALFTSCRQERKKTEFMLTFVVRNDSQEPLGKVRIEVNGTALGETDTRGELGAVVPAFEGDRVQVQATCPEEYIPAESAQVTLQRFRNASSDLPTVWRSFECVPKLRWLAVVVRGRANLPVLYQGKEIGKTNPEGVTQVALQVANDTQVKLTLDTSGDPLLEPQNPEKVIEVAQADLAERWDQRFERATPKAKPTKRTKPKNKIQIIQTRRRIDF